MGDELGKRIEQARARAINAREQARFLEDHVTMALLVGQESRAAELRTRQSALLEEAKRLVEEAETLERQRAAQARDAVPAELPSRVVESGGAGAAGASAVHREILALLGVAPPAPVAPKPDVPRVPVVSISPTGNPGFGASPVPKAGGAEVKRIGPYVIVGVLGQGGMGRVLRVRHEGWELDLALKIPLGQLTPSQRRQVVDEADAWAGLGLHPHVVTCYYATTVDDVPWIFAELVEGGSLASWISKRRLYEGDAPLARLLDVAMQMAIGLHHAHARGLVHQDMKPANVLMTTDGVAKVTDFGLARSGAGRGGAAGVGARLAEGGAGMGTGTLAATFAGLTPAYCSPEQAAVANGDLDGKITRRSDVWSWAATVLETFTGRIVWPLGPAAGRALSVYQPAAGIPAMPPELAALLARCFELDEAQRPASLREVADVIASFYARVTGRPVPTERRAYYDGADELYNRGTSLLALGAKDKALDCYERALQVDPQHFLSAYARAVLRWRDGGLLDDEAVQHVEDVRQFVALRSRAFGGMQMPRAEAAEMMAWMHAERGAIGAAEQLMDEARASRHGPPPTQDELKRVLVPGIVAGKMVKAYPRTVSYALAEDGRHVAAAGHDKAGAPWLMRWDHERLAAIAELPLAGAGELRQVAASRDGRRVLVVGSNSAWLHEAGESAARAIPSSAGGLAGAVSPDGNRIAIAMQNSISLRTWGLTDETILPVAAASAVLLSNRGDRLLMIRDGRLCVADAAGRVVFEVSRARHGAWPADGTWYLVERDDEAGRAIIEARRTDDDSVVWSRKVPEASAGFGLSGDGTTLITVTKDGMLRRWDTRIGRSITTAPIRVTGSPRAAMAARGGTLAAMVDIEGQLNGYPLPRELPRGAFPILRPTRSEELLGRQERLETALASANARADTDVVVAVSELDGLRQTPWIARLPEVRALWDRLAVRCAKGDLEAAWPSREILASSGPIRAVEADPNAEFVFSGCGDRGGATVWHAASGERVRTLLQGKRVTALAIAPLRDVLACVTDDGVVAFDWRQGNVLRAFQGFSPAPTVAVSASGHRVAAATGQSVYVWEVASGALVASVSAGSVVHRVALDAAGSLLLVAAARGLVRHELAAGRASAPFPASEETLDLTLSPCDRWALSGARDGTLRLWSMDGIAVYRAASENALTGVAMSHDRRLAVTVDGRGVAAVWGLPDAQRIAVLSGHTGPATDVAMTPSGRLAVTAGEDGRVRVWTLEWSLDPFPRPEQDKLAREVVVHLVQALGAAATAADATRMLTWAGLGHFGAGWAAEMLATVRG